MSGQKTNKKMILDQVGPLAEGMGLALLDALYVHEGGRTILRLIIDKRGGVGIEDCERLSGIADALISEEMGLDDFDVFEVSSPGLDRPLNTLEDCRRHEGEWVRISLYQAVDGEKKFFGKLVVEDEMVGIERESGERKLFSMQDIARVKREIVF
jgi:ribosome maturation factor RimP